MKRVLNGQMDFTPVVERLPFLIRDSETNQFILLLKTLREVRFLKSIKLKNIIGNQNAS